MSKFSLDNFKKWMEQQEPQEELAEATPDEIGCGVQAKIGLKKLLAKMTIEEGCLEDVGQEFLENGGTIAKADEDQFVIEVDSGSFSIHKMYVELS